MDWSLIEKLAQFREWQKGLCVDCCNVLKIHIHECGENPQNGVKMGEWGIIRFRIVER